MAHDHVPPLHVETLALLVMRVIDHDFRVLAFARAAALALGLALVAASGRSGCALLVPENLWVFMRRSRGYHAKNLDESPLDLRAKPLWILGHLGRPGCGSCRRRRLLLVDVAVQH